LDIEKSSRRFMAAGGFQLDSASRNNWLREVMAKSIPIAKQPAAQGSPAALAFPSTASRPIRHLRMICTKMRKS
jgi:hypothetical protein